jgi:ADP-ribose pyrophosphatase YjhB (NUDIX family)
MSIAVGLFVSQGRVLLLRRDAGLWSLPSGESVKGEHLQRTAERAVQEALGWRLPAQGLCALSLERREDVGQLVAAFAFTTPPDAAMPAGAAWFPVADLADLVMTPADRLRIADALAAPPAPAPVACRRATVRGEQVIFYG